MPHSFHPLCHFSQIFAGSYLMFVFLSLDDFILRIQLFGLRNEWWCWQWRRYKSNQNHFYESLKPMNFRRFRARIEFSRWSLLSVFALYDELGRDGAFTANLWCVINGSVALIHLFFFACFSVFLVLLSSVLCGYFSSPLFFWSKWDQSLNITSNLSIEKKVKANRINQASNVGQSDVAQTKQINKQTKGHGHVRSWGKKENTFNWSGVIGIARLYAQITRTLHFAHFVSTGVIFCFCFHLRA